ncbi:hypothetical protein D3C78_1113520 [compost metagenome]
MGGAGHRVLVDADRRGEEARDEIVAIARRSDDHSLPGQARQGGEIRCAVAHRLFGLQQHQQLVGTKYIDWRDAQGPLQLHRAAHRTGNQRREVQRQHPRLADHPQRAGERSELDLAPRLAKYLEQHTGGRQGRMAAQWHLHLRCEPADAPAFALPHHERGLGKVVLGGDVLHQLIGQPAIQPIDDCRVAAEGTVGEGIHLMELESHCSLPCSNSV